MPTFAQYQSALEQAQAAGDTEAVTYFQGQLSKAPKVQSGYSGRDHGALPTSGTMVDSALQGLSFGFVDELAGIGGGLASEAMNQLGYEGEGFSKGYGEIRDWVRDRATDYEERHPYLSAGAEIASGLAFPLGAIRSGASGFGTAAKAGAAYGAGKSAPDNDAPIGDQISELATDTATGAAFGMGGQAAARGLSALGRAVFPQASLRARTPEYRSNVERLEQSGVRTSAGARLDNPTARQSEEVMSRFMSNPDAQREPGQQLMRELMRRANFAPEDATRGVLSRESAERASQRFSDGYTQALQNVRVRMPDMDPYLRRIEAGYSQLMSHEQRAQITRILGDFRSQIGRNRTITGTDYKRLRSNIGKMAARAQRSDRDSFLAPVYGALQQTLDDAFRQNAPSRSARLLRQLDRRYGAYKLLRNFADTKARPEEFLGTMANKAREGRGRIDREFSDLLNAFDDVFLKGGWKSSGTPEGMASITNIIPPIPAAVRSITARGSDAMNRALPSGLPLPPHMAGFIAGQQSEELEKQAGTL